MRSMLIDIYVRHGRYGEWGQVERWRQCVCERERQTDRQTDRQKGRYMERVGETERRAEMGERGSA